MKTPRNARAAASIVVLLLSACEVRRDLDPSRFACSAGGTCSSQSLCVPALDGEDACGGDPTGAFSIDALCGDGWIRQVLSSATPDCQAGVLGITAVGRPGGSLSFTPQEDGSTYALRWNAAVEMDFSVPALCFGSCLVAELALQRDLGPTTCVSSTTAPGSCACTFSGELALDEQGTWAAGASSLTLIPEDAPDVRRSARFCREGNALRLSFDGTGIVAAQ